MIILKTAPKEEAKSLFEKEGLVFTEYSECLCAKDGNEILGYCLFDIKDKEMTVRAIQPQNDLMLLDGVLRSTLHIAAIRNLTKALWAEKAPERVFRTLGFVSEENTLNINKLYEGKCCSCKKADSE